jgi:hypothetical protein
MNVISRLMKLTPERFDGPIANSASVKTVNAVLI